ncbi:uncharacterized protein N7515_002841 [Penicillium bovifimosum]|uniref:Uncharacterized protein n=1 Tax=Penicillium bovifimosum TaxID=126998 RepID=A0A9W9HCI2_9EURO|nr:uncharacterized protein N7515_002841 [Penicillium bovifimosum]KAJ5144054.1 hypothetical protein N7515_002841 [Penicillium bovifimosum]
MEEFTRPVLCQRPFSSRVGSKYVLVRGDPDIPTNANPPQEISNRVIDELVSAFAEEYEGPRPVQAEERDDANPWIHRTRWTVYLRGINTQAWWTAAPDAESSDPTEMAARAIWDAMPTVPVGRVTQQVCTETGHIVRTEAVRTEQGRQPHQPLQAS